MMPSRGCWQIEMSEQDDSLRQRIRKFDEELVRIVAGEPDAQVTVSPAQDELDALAIGVNVLAQDLRDELSAQQRLRAERDQVFETMSDALFVCNEGGRIRLVNSAACELLGFSREELVSRTIEGLFAEPLTIRRTGVSRERGVSASEQTLVTKSGEKIPVHVTTTEMSPAQDVDFGGTVWVARDIRELRRLIEEAATAEAERKRAHDLDVARRRLEQTLSELNATQAQLLHAQKMEAIGQLAGGIAHDFNNLLLVIMGCGSLVEMRLPKDHPAVTDIEEINLAARRASTLTRQLLTISRRQPIEPARVELNALVRSAEGMLRRLLREDIEWRVDLAPDVWPIFVDAGQVEQVLVNLAVNARDAMPEGGRFQVATTNLRHDGGSVEHPDLRSGEYVVLEVRDDGVGMDDATRQHIFDPFFTTKAPGRGTGLGLATCYSIVKQAGGHIEVDSEPGSGTCFRLYFPRTEAAAMDAPPPRQAKVTGGQETILVVEDESAVRGVTVRALERFGYRVLEACNGCDAVEKFGDTRFDVLVTDMIMPQMGGEELVGKLRESRPNLPVLFVSGYSDNYPDISTDPRSTVLHKPFRPAQLEEALRDLLARRSRRYAAS